MFVSRYSMQLCFKINGKKIFSECAHLLINSNKVLSTVVVDKVFKQLYTNFICMQECIAVGVYCRATARYYSQRVAQSIDFS